MRGEPADEKNNKQPSILGDVGAWKRTKTAIFRDTTGKFMGSLSSQQKQGKIKKIDASSYSRQIAG